MFKIFGFKKKSFFFSFFRDDSILISDAKYKAKYGEGLKILSPKQMLQRLPIALAKIIGGNPSENLLNEIRQIIRSLYDEKEITKKIIQLVNYTTKLWIQ